MASPACTMLVAEETPRAFIKLGGRAVANCGPGFVQLITGLRARGVTDFVLELSDCVMMDSTFVGQLARFALDGSEEGDHDCPHFTLVNPNSQITELLDTIYVLDLVNVLHDPALAADRANAHEVETAAADRQAVTECCLDAHKILRTLHQDNAAKFKDVVRFLEEDLARSSPAAK